jgi:hypothetical protein
LQSAISHQSSELGDHPFIAIFPFSDVGGVLEEGEPILSLVVLGEVSSEDRDLRSPDDAIVFSQSGELGFVGLLLSVERLGHGVVR